MTEKKLKIKIVTPEKIILKEEYDEVTIPTTAGEVGILPRHSPLVAALKPGEVRLKKDGVTNTMAVSSGFIEVRPGSKLIILADTAERAEDIDIERAEVARQRAEEMLKEKQHAEDVDYAKMQALIEKEMARVKVGRKYKKLPQARQ